MKCKKIKNQIFIKFDKGEELVSSLLSFLQKEKILAGSISSIGAISNPVLGYFNTETKQYEKKELNGDFELLSLQGNIGLTDNKITTHIHVIVADKNLNTYGGHLFSTNVSITCEMFINIFSSKLERVYDNKIKLHLLSPRS